MMMMAMVKEIMMIALIVLRDLRECPKKKPPIEPKQLSPNCQPRDPFKTH